MDVSTLAEFLPALALAIALAASAGLRAWLPLLLAAGLARLGVLDLGPSFQFLASTRALVLFGVATAIELVGDKIPAVDHALDVIGTPLRPAAGAVLGSWTVRFRAWPALTMVVVNLLVRGGGRYVAAGMVVHQDEAGGLVLQGQLQNLARIHHRLVDGALLDDLFGQDFVLAVQEQHPELLILQAPHGGAAIIDEGLQGGDFLALEGFLLQVELDAGFGQVNETGGAFLEAHKLHEGFGRGVQHLGKGAEALDEAFGQRFHVGVRDGEGEEEFQDLIVLEGGGAAGQKPAAQALPVPVVVTFQVLFDRPDVRPGLRPLPADLRRHGANFNSHAHTLASDGVLSHEGEFLPLPSLDTAAVMEVFRRLLLGRLHRARRLSEDFMLNLLSWVHPGFSVFA